MKKAYIQPEFDLLKLSSSEDILLTVTPGDWDTEAGEGGLVEDGLEDSWN